MCHVSFLALVRSISFHQHTVKTAFRKKVGREHVDNKGMSVEVCCENIVRGVERGEREIYIPSYMRYVRLVYILLPEWIEYFSKRKYT